MKNKISFNEIEVLRIKFNEDVFNKILKLSEAAKITAMTKIILEQKTKEIN